MVYCRLASSISDFHIKSHSGEVGKGSAVVANKQILDLHGKPIYVYLIYLCRLCMTDSVCIFAKIATVAANNVHSLSEACLFVFVLTIGYWHGWKIVGLTGVNFL